MIHVSKMTKQECLSKLDSIIESTCSQAKYMTACNYYDTVSDLTEEEFDTVSDWYENSQILSLFKTSGRIGQAL